MLTEAVTKAIVTIKDLHHSIKFPSWFREPLLFTSCFLKLAGCNAALLHKVGALTSAMWLTSVPALRTACDGVDDSSVTDLWCSSHFTAIVPLAQTWKGEKAEVAWSAEPHEGVQSTQKCGSMQPVRMTQLLVAFFPAGEMCGFVKHFRKKKSVEAYLPLLETLPLQMPWSLQYIEATSQTFVISILNSWGHITSFILQCFQF